MNEKNEFLKNVRIFCDLTNEEIQDLLELLHPRELEEGETLFRQGDAGGELFVVESGALGIAVTLDDGKNLEIAAFKKGDFFGEMSIFEKEPRSATCYAKSLSRLLAMNEREFFQLVECHSFSPYEPAFNVRMHLTGRIECDSPFFYRPGPQLIRDDRQEAY